MENIPLLLDLIVLLAASIPISIVCRFLNIPVIVGFLITGILIGPNNFALIQNSASVNSLSEIGVILLLFTIGLEISLERFVRIKRFVFLGGSLQVILTIIAVVLGTKLAGLSTQESVFFGFIVSLSSTAIVLKSYLDKGEIHTPYGHMSTGILLFQDICVVPMMLLCPLLAQPETFSIFAIAKTLLIAGIAITLIIGLAYFFVPLALAQIVKFKDREIFSIFVILLCLGTAWITHKAGLSLAIGAFIAGLVLSKSDYSNQIVSEVLPLKDVFISIFFISIGMLVQISFISQIILSVIGITLVVILIKLIFASATVLILGYPVRIALITGLGLAQIGEFSFLLLNFGQSYTIINSYQYQYMLAISILTMIIAPFMIKWSPKGLGTKKTGSATTDMDTDYDIEKLKCTLTQHVIIVGYGLNGKNLAKVLKETGIKYTILEINANSVTKAKKNGEPIFYGDATRAEIMEKLSIKCARVIVFAISDPATTRRGVWLARKLNPEIYILVRTRYLSEIEELHKVGANEVIPEEFETSVEIFSRVLQKFHIPSNIIDQQVKIIRKEGYRMLRGLSLEPYNFADLQKVLNLSLTETFLVEENSAALGKTLLDLNLRDKSGVTIIAVIRNGKAYTNPQKDFIIEPQDILVLLGSHKQLNDAMEMLTD
jgi:CPA2 family monovalent cation:H+ antiporter-2